MEKVTAEIEVDAPVHRVYERWARLEELPSFMSMVEEVTRTGGEDVTHWVVRVAGVRREFDARTTELVPDERISWASIDEEMHAGTVRFMPIDAERTRVAVELGWAPKSFVEKAGAALNIDRAAIEADLRHFKEQIEDDASGADFVEGRDPDLLI
ncbi:putative membrane protein [Microbacterium sp. W4I4]|uniref:SRPBCC family protein n=1 Tax=Microbacterium sp. W4I4 TaxID=3042295 RepID=UPI002780437D|nr:SRPBCC family protein [Microbacterium sp. W4I4]MDQ0615430.1 putative membrane protein [Microbacterium sp. W4I4]